MTVPDRVALITGAGSGIGRTVALTLATAGFQLVLVGRRKEALEATAARAGAQCLAVPTDIAQPEAVAKLFALVKQRFQRLDLLFNNAGTFTPAVPFEELTDDQWNSCVAVNLTGAFLCARGAFRLMKDQVPRGGRIINNGSISAHTPRPLSAPYTATKHAITGLTKCLALDGRPYDIACGQIDIGNAATEMTAGIAKGALQPDGSRKPEPTIEAEYVAQAVQYMATLPLHANVQFLTVVATQMPFIGRG